MKTLITGASGFIGSNLAKHLNAKENELYLCDLVAKNPNFISGDLTNMEFVNKIIEEIKPDCIYQLTGTFSNNYEIDYKCNTLITKNILDSVLQNKLKTRILLVGSAAEYGLLQESDSPISEFFPLNAMSIYGLTKIFQTNLMMLYHRKYNMDIVMARTFNIIGKGQSDKLFVGNLFKQIDEYKQGKIEKIILGNLNNKRDYLTIEKVVNYFELIMQKGISGEIYNVASGHSKQIKEIMEQICFSENIDTQIIETKINPDFKYDVPDIYADITKLKNLTKS